MMKNSKKMNYNSKIVGKNLVRQNTFIATTLLQQKNLCLDRQRFKPVLVGVAGFEPTTSTSQMWRDTRLRYTPDAFFQKC